LEELLYETKIGKNISAISDLIDAIPHTLDE